MRFLKTLTVSGLRAMAEVPCQEVVAVKGRCDTPAENGEAE